MGCLPDFSLLSSKEGSPWALVEKTGQCLGHPSHLSWLAGEPGMAKVASSESPSCPVFTFFLVSSKRLAAKNTRMKSEVSPALRECAV
jgi:hypothetical protein